MNKEIQAFKDEVGVALLKIANGEHGYSDHAQALASIQASTVELFTRLVGDDEAAPQAPANWVTGKAFGRNALRAELRTKIKGGLL